ncbi:MAG: helix-turn-helix domain-containing protein [Spirochaetales bacterium]|jgi:transcriptional regulator with XRE-family HTH domain|nr:helix-turn-helix domain-containing protein [Spirochaetales bacterium]
MKALRLALGVSQTDFSKRLFTSKGFYGDMENGKKNINERYIHIIATQFNVNKEWIKTGKGEMFHGKPPDVRLEKLIEIYNELDGSLRECLVEQSGVLLKLQREKTAKEENV